MTPTVPVHDVVVLAGGAGRRLGGVSKPEVLLDGVSLLDRVLTATTSARRVVVVGPSRLARPGVPTVMEEPAGGGPVAGIDAGLAFLDAAGDGPSNDAPSNDAPSSDAPSSDAVSEDAAPDDGVPVLVLACDVPRVGGVVPGLLAALAGAPQLDGVRLVDADGHAQLVAAYRRRPLRVALAALRGSGGVHGVSVRRLGEHLRTGDHPDPHGHGRDADTWEDVAYLEDLIARGEDVAESAAAETDRPVGRSADEPVGGRELHRWVAATGAELGVDPDAVDVELLLDLSRDLAHRVARPAVPLTGFLAGYAVARAGGDRAALDRVVARIAELAAAWPDRPERRATTGTDDAPAPEERTP